jgi:hypothetical protein
VTGWKFTATSARKVVIPSRHYVITEQIMKTQAAVETWRRWERGGGSSNLNMAWRGMISLKLLLP